MICIYITRLIFLGASLSVIPINGNNTVGNLLTLFDPKGESFLKLFPKLHELFAVLIVKLSSNTEVQKFG